MFGNRFYKAKLIGALLVIALLGIHAARKGLSINPALQYCIAEPERWDGVDLLAGGRVVETGDAACTIDNGLVRVRVTDLPHEVEKGQRVEIRGTFRADGGPHVSATRMRTPTGTRAGRWWVEIISVIALLLTLGNLWRRFSFHPKTLQVGRGD